MVNTLFNKVLGENEQCVFYFYIKTEGTFWPTQYIDINGEKTEMLALSDKVFKAIFIKMLQKLQTHF